MKTRQTIVPEWRWGTAEGSRDLDRLLDRRLSFRKKLEWLEEAETLTLQLQAGRDQQTRNLKKRSAESGKAEIGGIHN